MNLLDKFSNKSQLLIVALVVFSVFVGLGCISASASDSGNSRIAVGGLDYPIIHNNQDLGYMDKKPCHDDFFTSFYNILKQCFLGIGFPNGKIIEKKC